MDARLQSNSLRPGMLAHLGEFLRWLLLLALVTAAGSSFLLYFVHSRLDDEIRLYVETKFKTNYPDLLVRVRSAHRVKGRGIEVRGLMLAEPRQGGKPVPLVYVEELFAECPTDLTDLASGEVRASKLALRGIKLWATRFPDGSWSSKRLLPLPKFSDRPPPVTIEDGQLELMDLEGPAPRVMSLRNVSLQLDPVISQTSAGQIPSPPPFRVRGSLAGNHIRRLQMQGYIDVLNGEWDLSGAVNGFDLSAQTIDALPGEMADRLDQLRSATGSSDFEFAIAKANLETPISLSLAGSFAGRIEDARLPQPLMNVWIPFQLDPRGLRVQDAVAQAGSTNLQLSAHLTSLRKGSPFAIRLKARRVRLDEQLARALPPEWRDVWSKFSPRGVIDTDLVVRFDGHKTSTAVTADLIDASFAYYKFPYRVHHARGRIEFVDNVLQVTNIQASANGHPVQINGTLNNPGPDQTGYIDAQVAEPIPIDDQLIDALRGDQQHVVRLLAPTGSVHVRSRFERLDPSMPPRNLIRIDLLNCSLRHRHFPYPLYNITGTLVMENGEWTFRDLEAYNDSGFVTCEGELRRDPVAGSILTMRFHASDVPIEDELRDALSKNARQFWHSLQPRGTIDEVNVDLQYASATRDLDVAITAQKRDATGNVEGRSITVKPTWLPYQLDDVVGLIRYQDGAIQFDHIQGSHGGATVDLSGHFQHTPNERWSLQVTQIHVDRLRTDRQLVSALPRRLGQSVAKLNLDGPVSVSGSVGMDGMIGLSKPLSTEWNLDFDVVDANIECGIRLEHIHGEMHLSGSLTEKGHYSRGELNVDSLVYKGIQITQIKGPISIDDEHLAFGELIRRAQSDGDSRPIRSSALGGILAGSGQVTLNAATWSLEGELFEGNLATISQELAPGRHDLQGKAYGSVSLRGTSKGTHNLRGNGNIQLRQADIYQLPVMIRFLKLAKVKPPDETAFTSSDIAFHIEADRIYFDRIDFHGDAINLNGHGEMSLDRTINLTFETSVALRDSPVDRILRPLIRESGGLFEMYVTGTLDKPEVIRGVDRAIQQVFPETPVLQEGSMSRLPTPYGRERLRSRR